MNLCKRKEVYLHSMYNVASKSTAKIESYLWRSYIVR